MANGTRPAVQNMAPMEEDIVMARRRQNHRKWWIHPYFKDNVEQYILQHILDNM